MTVEFISDDSEVKFIVNGEITKVLDVGDTFKLEDASQLGVKEVLTTARGDGNAIVTFYLGANKLTLTDTDFTNSAFDGTIDVNDEELDDVTFDFKATGPAATATSGQLDLTELTWAFAPEEEVDVAGERTLVDPVLGAFEIRLGGIIPALDSEDRDALSFERSGSNDVRLKMTTNSDDLNEIVFHRVSGSGDANPADSGNDTIEMNDGATVSEDEYVIFRSDDDSFLVEFKDINGETNEGKYKVAGSSEGQKDFTWSDDDAVTLVLGGLTFELFSDPATSNTTLIIENIAASDSADADDSIIEVANDLVIASPLVSNLGAKVHLYDLGAWSFSNFVAIDTTANGYADDDFTVQLPTGTVDVAFADAGTLEDCDVSVDGTALGNFNSTRTAAATDFAEGGVVYIVQVTAGTANNDDGTCDVDELGAINFYLDSDQTDDAGVVVDADSSDLITEADPDFEASTTLTAYADPGFLVIEEAEGDLTVENEVVFSFDDDDTDIELSTTFVFTDGLTALQTLDTSDDDRQQAITQYGTWIELDTDSDSVDMAYPDEQAVVEVFLAPTGAQVTTVSGASGGMVKQLVPINTGVMKLDTDFSGTALDYKDFNAIVVGGPCANSVAAALMGNAESCQTGFSENSAIVKLFEHSNGNVAMLVAGWDGVDTQYAGLALIDGSVSENGGMEVSVVGTSKSDITVSKV